MQTLRTQSTTMAITHDWRRWIAENLILNVPPEELVNTLIAHGCSHQDAVHEVQQAFDSPYLAGARQGQSLLNSRLKKREWVLDIYRKLNQMRPHALHIDHKHQLTRQQFFNDYYFTNRPVIITGMLENWPARQHWSLDYFDQLLGEQIVEVQARRNQDEHYEINSQEHKETCKFSEFIHRVRTAGHSNDVYMTANNSGRNRLALRSLWRDIGLIDEYLEHQSEQDGFFWLGPAGTRTPFHHDLTNNFMAQIIGRKRVKIIPACEVKNLYNHKHCYTHVEGHSIDVDRFPAMKDTQVLECVLEPGELLFLPVGCWHYVEALDVSVTMSFTNFIVDNDHYSDYECYGQL